MGRPRKKEQAEMLVAIDTGCVEIKGTPHFFYKGITRVRADHPIAKEAGQFFKPIDAHYEVEQATAAPGERRGEID